MNIVELDVAKHAYVVVTDMNDRGRGEIAGIRFCAMNSIFEGRTHFFLLRYKDGEPNRVWSMEWTSNTLVNVSGDEELMARDLALVRMFVT